MQRAEDRTLPAIGIAAAAGRGGWLQVMADMPGGGKPARAADRADIEGHAAAGIEKVRAVCRIPVHFLAVDTGAGVGEAEGPLAH